MNHIQQAQRLRQILNQKYATPISIARLSHEVALSPYYLIRLFQSVYNQTPHQYLMQLRIQRAKELLITSKLSITEICATVGYESLGSFSTLFYKTVGLSPRAYRAKGKAIRHSGYIPLCTCLRHGLDSTPDA